MSISSEITRIQNKRDLSLQAVADKGVTVPAGSTIDDLPDLIDLIVVEPTYSVSKTLTNVTSSNDDTKVIAGNSFYADLTPTSGYAITSITVTMGGVDVTDQVFQPWTGSKAITANGTYNASDDSLSGYDRVVVNVPPTQSDLGTKAITANGTYTASDDSLDGYSEVTVNVPTGSTPTGTKSISISVNGTTTEDVANYASAEIAVNVPNSYAESDEGKVVSNGALVSQTSDTVTANGTVDTTLINSLTVNVSTGGEGESINWDDYAAGRYPTGEAVLSDSVTTIAKKHFDGLTGLTGITANGVTTLAAGAFINCTHMLKGIFHACTTIGTTCFEVCGRYETAKQGLWVFPALTAVPADAFRQTNIGVIDLGPNCASIAQRAFYQPTYGGYIGEIILRKTDAVVTVANANGLQKIDSNTKVYVPSALIESYKAATNWSTKGDIFYAIEGSVYENTYADGTPIT